MFSNASLAQRSSEESSQIVNLIEAAFKASSIENFGDYIMPSITEVMKATAVFLFIADSQLLAHNFTYQGFQPETASEIKNRCVKEFERTRCQADPPDFSQSVIGEVLSRFALHPLRDNMRCVGLLGFRGDETTPQISSEVLARILNLLAKVAGRLLERAELDRRLFHLNTYWTVSSMLTQSLDLHELLEAALNCCMQVVSADAASVLLLDDEKKNFNFYQVEGPAKPLLMAASFPADKGIAGAVLQTQQPELINEVHSDSRFFERIDSQTGFQTRNMIAVPLTAGKEAVGVLEVLNKAGGVALQKRNCC